MLRSGWFRSLAACALACAVCTFATAGDAPAGHGQDAQNAARQESVREGPQRVEPPQSGVGELVTDAGLPELKDLDGKPLRLADYRGRPATVICLTSAGCPIAKKYGPTLADLERAYRERGVAFLLLNPDSAESPQRLRDAFNSLKKLGFGGRYVHDPRARWRDACGRPAPRRRSCSTVR